MRINQIKNCLILFLLLTPFVSFSQYKEKQKAEKALIEKRYERALKYSQKALKYDSRDPLALLYKSQSLYYLHNTPATTEKYQNAIKDAVKAAQKALEKDDKGTLKIKFQEYLTLLAKANNNEGELFFKQERFNKAEQYYKLSIKFNPNDTNALFYLGSCYWFQGQKMRSVEYLKTVSEYNYSSFSEGLYVNPAHFKSYRYLTEYYMESEKWDSANIYISMGLEMFPDDYVLRGNKYGLYRVHIRDLPPSINYLAEVRAALQDFPTDSFFLTKENALYIYLLNNALINNEVEDADSLLGIFVIDRLERSKRDDRHLIEKIDVFIGDTPQEIFYELLNYTSRNYHKEIFVWLIQKWTSENLNKDFVSINEYIALADNEFKNGNTEFATLMLLSEYIRPTRKKAGELMLIETVSKISVSNLSLLGLDYTQETLQEIRKGQYKNKVDKLYKDIKFRFIDSLAVNNYFYRAYTIYNEALKEFPSENKFLKEEKLKIIANLDFKLNYYGTRIASWGKEPKNGEIAFVTDMYPNNCEQGTLSDEILERVINRINYFRRVSGIQKQSYFAKDFNNKCQFAALTFEANKNLTHNPVDGLRCYTEIGKEGAVNSLLVKNQNPSLAITALMGDNNSSQGNRRWLLYPFSLNMGFGAGPNSQVLWVMDNSNLTDSNYYKNNFIAYPNDGYTPKMLSFPKWTFSILDNLEGASIKVKNNKGKEIPVTVEPLVSGYAMPTLVFSPEFELDKSSNDQKFSVTIRLKNGKTFNYNVILFTPTLD